MSFDLNRILAERIATLPLEHIKRTFEEQDEFVLIDEFLPAEAMQELLAELPRLAPLVHRNFIPKHKKGGSVSRFDLDRIAPAYARLYNAKPLVSFVEQIAGRELRTCPANDPHTYALYYYTEPGDHIGYHYDTSYYRGERYTILIGLVPAPSCELEYQLHTRNPDVEVETHRVQLQPGALVLFNGDKLYHRITPIAENERRIALTLEYITNADMHPLLRFVSNMKDAIAYFGFRQVFNRRRGDPRS